MNFPHARVAGRRPCALPAYCICGAKSPENCGAYKCAACRQREKDKIKAQEQAKAGGEA